METQKINALLTTRMRVSRMHDSSITEKLSINQEIQWTALPSPITLMVSFSLDTVNVTLCYVIYATDLISFSWTMLLMMVEAE